MGIWGLSGCERTETYTVTFDANGGTGTMQQQLFTEGEQQALNRNAFTREGYSFSGWNGNGVNYIDGQVITITTDMTLYAQWTSNSGQQGGGSNGGSGEGGNPSGNQLNGHEYVDLGLPSGTKWATCNVGANTPSGTGYYYAWGETEPKTNYYWGNYRYIGDTVYIYDGNLLDRVEIHYTKYCNNSNIGYNGYVDNLVTLEPDDDAATANWGRRWRMPTQEEMQELLSSCNKTWTTRDDVNGCLFTGPNGNSIFLPAAGFRYESYLYYSYDEGPSGYYLSSSLSTNDEDSFGFQFYNRRDNVCLYSIDFTRRNGVPVRPVVAR